jgi:serine/threonine protein phosphatase PrpC
MWRLLTGPALLCCAGDSIALMARNGASHRLSVEHRGDNEAEAARVVEAGGRVARTRPGGAARVMGTSNQTRYKSSMVTR